MVVEKLIKSRKLDIVKRADATGKAMHMSRLQRLSLQARQKNMKAVVTLCTYYISRYNPIVYDGPSNQS